MSLSHLKGFHCDFSMSTLTMAQLDKIKGGSQQSMHTAPHIWKQSQTIPWGVPQSPETQADNLGLNNRENDIFRTCHQACAYWALVHLPLPLQTLKGFLNAHWLCYLLSFQWFFSEGWGWWGNLSCLHNEDKVQWFLGTAEKLSDPGFFMFINVS